MPFKPARQGLTKVIRFEKDKVIKEKLSPLVSPELVIGIKQTKVLLYRHHKEKESQRVPHLVLIFYDEK